MLYHPSTNTQNFLFSFQTSSTSTLFCRLILQTSSVTINYVIYSSNPHPIYDNQEQKIIQEFLIVQVKALNSLLEILPIGHHLKKPQFPIIPPICPRASKRDSMTELKRICESSQRMFPRKARKSNKNTSRPFILYYQRHEVACFLPLPISSFLPSLPPRRFVVAHQSSSGNLLGGWWTVVRVVFAINNDHQN